MTLYIGSTPLSKAYIGSTEVKYIYVGNQEIWSNFGVVSMTKNGDQTLGLDPAGWTRLILVSDQGKREDLTRWQRKITPKSSAATQSRCTATPTARP